ncbi:Nisin biosynthesis protein NisC [Streptomyces sp. ADI95-16]|uniref:lanthionine synthetase C family protein n=1 Tax=Streptomyces sp. ADI95-16 TaxID=1522758 RepID=UPI000F3A80D4|nr:lanthionine synthetase C family protein [Streptomyces sp. ADI95-16]AYV29728.1 Nisin biosynthesis protein NisC [Streptomyces sp. ADI95-16]
MTPTTLPPAPLHHDAARRVADTIAGRLADAGAVAAATGVPGVFTSSELHWSPPSLGRGHAGISLLFSSRVTRDPVNAALAHGHLARSEALRQEADRTEVGLYGDVCGLSFAMECARRATGGYGRALASLDPQVAAQADGWCELVRREPRGTMSRYDVISGLSGFGRSLLLRGGTCRDSLTRVLETLVAMARSVGDPETATPPGLWADGPPSSDGRGSASVREHGHLNLGIAHGITGPLALLALAHREGVVVKGQREAAEQLISVLGRFEENDAYGPFWPGIVSREEWFAGRVEGIHRPRPSWCYGTPGVARALQLAGESFGWPDQVERARRAVAALAGTPLSGCGLVESGLCHGLAGTLHMLGYFTEPSPEPGVICGMRDDLAAAIVARFRPEYAFGYRVEMLNSPVGGDFPGFLEGAAGIALALDAYADGGASSLWDAALLAT